MFLPSIKRVFVHCRSKLCLKHTRVEFSTIERISDVRELCRPNVMQNCFGTSSREASIGYTNRKEPTKLLSVEDERRELMTLWPAVISEIIEIEDYSDIPDVTKWLTKVLDYNVPGGRKTRAVPLINAYRMIVPPDKLTDENIRLVRMIGWCLELLQTFLLMVDDIVDRSKIRRKRPCWYIHNDVGLVAINDALLLETIAYEVLRNRLKGRDAYIEIMELIQETTKMAIMGQCLDLLSSNFGKKINLDLFTEERYNSIVKYKTGYYAYLLPIRTAMFLAGLKDTKMHSEIKPLLLAMGHYYQVQNDFLDCYGDSNITNKDGTDIQEGKCTWLIVTALQRATSEQRKILDDCYGVKDPEKVKLVKRVYDDMGLSDSYWIYEKETYNLLTGRIKQLSCGLPNDLFLYLLEKIRNGQ